MILGISGVAGSGKDTVADLLVKKHGFVRVSLADPLKRICRDVYDFSDEQLYGPSEMRNAPDKRYLRMKAGALGWTDVRAFCKDGKADFKGYAYEGKEHLVTYYGPEDNFGFLPSPPEDVYLTPRYALQQLGTEWGRDCYNNTWIDLAIRTAKRFLEYHLGLKPNETISYTQCEGLVKVEALDSERVDRVHRGVVIPDVRFHNEVAAIKEAGGKLVRITRSGAGLEGGAGQHRSETEQSEIPDSVFDYHIDNSGPLHMLELMVDSVMDRLTGRICDYSETQEDIPPALRK